MNVEVMLPCYALLFYVLLEVDRAPAAMRWPGALTSMTAGLVLFLTAAGVGV